MVEHRLVTQRWAMAWEPQPAEGEAEAGEVGRQQQAREEREERPELALQLVTWLLQMPRLPWGSMGHRLGSSS